MILSKKIILFGAGIIGRRALNFFGTDRVYCFADNNKGGETFWGKQVISFDELLQIKDDYDIVLSVGIMNLPALEEQCSSIGLHYHLFRDFVSYDKYESNPEIRQFENKHKGERCFLVGNGPSLRADDLTMLHERSEISFGCNSISKIFGQTPWRPDYHVVSDLRLFAFQSALLAETEAEYKFYPKLHDILREDTTATEALFLNGKGHTLYFNLISGYTPDKAPSFSPDVSMAVYDSGSVMYAMIQFAVYMGFTEIYLTGVDGDSGGYMKRESSSPEYSHFYTEEKDIYRKFNLYATSHSPKLASALILNAYNQAKQYATEHDVEICNATRGGVLEVFPRINFDALFHGES